jgi:hypothetical protein
MRRTLAEPFSTRDFRVRMEQLSMIACVTKSTHSTVRGMPTARIRLTMG